MEAKFRLIGRRQGEFAEGGEIQLAKPELYLNENDVITNYISVWCV